MKNVERKTMNERIRELAIEAGAGEWGDSIVPAMMDIEKFAELIVRECADVCELIGSVSYSGVAYEYAECAKEIRRQFGVE